MPYTIYYHRDDQSPKLMYKNLLQKAMWARLEKMSQQAQRSVFADGIVNEAQVQRGGYYYGEQDKEGCEE
jgi:hypothetical protein